VVKHYILNPKVVLVPPANNTPRDSWKKKNKRFLKHLYSHSRLFFLIRFRRLTIKIRRKKSGFKNYKRGVQQGLSKFLKEVRPKNFILLRAKIKIKKKIELKKIKRLWLSLDFKGRYDDYMEGGWLKKKYNKLIGKKVLSRGGRVKKNIFLKGAARKKKFIRHTQGVLRAGVRQKPRKKNKYNRLLKKRNGKKNFRLGAVVMGPA